MTPLQHISLRPPWLSLIIGCFLFFSFFFSLFKTASLSDFFYIYIYFYLEISSLTKIAWHIWFCALSGTKVTESVLFIWQRPVHSGPIYCGWINQLKTSFSAYVNAIHVLQQQILCQSDSKLGYPPRPLVGWLKPLKYTDNQYRCWGCWMFVCAFRNNCAHTLVSSVHSYLLFTTSVHFQKAHDLPVAWMFALERYCSKQKWKS